MRLLIDANLSPRVAARLRAAGYDAVHVADCGLLAASDDRILAAAAEDDRTIVSADADFGTLLALGGHEQPSVVLLRSADQLTPAGQADLLVANLPAVARRPRVRSDRDVARGRARVRLLPIVKKSPPQRRAIALKREVQGRRPECWRIAEGSSWLEARPMRFKQYTVLLQAWTGASSALGSTGEG